jgi:ATP-dependent Lhr-like helicase
LYKDGFIEPPSVSDKPYDVLLHQILSIVKGHSGIELSILEGQLKDNFAFAKIELHEIKDIISHLISADLLEKIQQEVIIGVEGEWVVNNKEFYSVFKTEENFKVIHSGNTIGDVAFTPQIIEGENIYLAAKIWKITYVDEKAKKIEVLPAKDGKKPKYLGRGAIIHSRIRESMLDVLFADDDYVELNDECKLILKTFREEFDVFKIQDTGVDRPLMNHLQSVELFTFTGTRVNRTLSFLLSLLGVNNDLNEKDCECLIDVQMEREQFLVKWGEILTLIPNIDFHLSQLLVSFPGILEFSKWGEYLPPKYQVEMLKQKYFDFPGCEKFISSTRFIMND